MLDRGNTLSKFTRPVSEIIWIKDKCFSTTVRQHIGLIIDRTHRVQGRRTRGIDLVRRHVEQHFWSIQCENRQLLSLGQTFGRKRLRIAADHRAHFARGHFALTDDVHRRIVRGPIQRVDNQISGIYRSVEVGSVPRGISHDGECRRRLLLMSAETKSAGAIGSLNMRRPVHDVPSSPFEQHPKRAQILSRPVRERFRVDVIGRMTKALPGIAAL